MLRYVSSPLVSGVLWAATTRACTTHERALQKCTVIYSNLSPNIQNVQLLDGGEAVSVTADCQGSCEDTTAEPTNLSELRHPRQAAISSFREGVGRRGVGWGFWAGRPDWHGKCSHVKGIITEQRRGSTTDWHFIHWQSEACRDYILLRRDMNRSPHSESWEFKKRFRNMYPKGHGPSACT